MKRGHITLLIVAAGLVVGLGLAAEPVHAHGMPVSFMEWGSFPADAARCQRAISRAAAICVKDAVAARTACVRAQLAGETCDAEATTTQVTAIRQRAAAAVEAFCSHSQLLNLRYVDMSDAQTDVISICRDLDTASISAVFGPALIGGSVAEVNDDTAACLSTTSTGAAKLARLAIRARQRALDRIASGNLSMEDKQALVDAAEQRIARARTMTAARINATCSSSYFTALYNRDVETFLDGIGKHADCLSGSVYVQDAVLCPAPMCGNGMQESGEECDDGNSFEGDACGRIAARRTATSSLRPTT
jgi:cysteine-rich repeat protein